MKRRYFIFASLLSFLGISALSFFRWIRKPDQNKVLAQPKFLSKICDEDTILMLGDAYLKLKPSEKIDHILLSNLLTGNSKKGIPGEWAEASIESQIEKRILYDFETDNIIVVQGWVLSVTEARQCAFFSILNQ